MKITFFPDSAIEAARLNETLDLPSLGIVLVRVITLTSLPQNYILVLKRLYASFVELSSFFNLSILMFNIILTPFPYIC